MLGRDRHKRGEFSKRPTPPRMQRVGSRSGAKAAGFGLHEVSAKAGQKLQWLSQRATCKA